MTAADRPSVTDNARAAAERRYPNIQPRALAESYHEVFVAGAEWASGRAETTTEQCEPRLSDHGQDKHCRACGVEHPAETATEWGVRADYEYEDDSFIETTNSEFHAYSSREEAEREAATNSNETLVRREVTQWTEVDEQ